MSERAYSLNTAPYIFVGKKPAVVLFGEERIEANTWKEVYAAIIMRCNQSPEHHEMLMYMRGKAAGKVRRFLSDRPDGMTRPYKIDENLYGETHYGAATLMHILAERILAPARFDVSDIRIIINN